ncbi:MAG: lipid-binding SYLF domain-containing protein [Phycisphaerales bacterium]
MTGFTAALRAIIVLPLLALAACSTPMGERMGQSVSIMRDFQRGKATIPSAVFEHAKGIAIIRETNAALLVGGSGGGGVFMKKQGFGWTAPVAINTAGASIGLQAGGQTRDIVIVMNTENEIAAFLDDGVYALAEISAVAGPAQTDPYNAGGPVPSTYYYLRTEGIFGGALVGGVHFSTADKINRECYGAAATVGDILNGKYPAPSGATVLWQSLN